MINYPQVVVKSGPYNHNFNVDLGNRTYASLLSNPVLNNPSPDLITYNAAITAVVTAIGVYGPKGNRGSHASLLDLRSKSLTLYQFLKAQAEYVQNAAELAAGNDYAAMSAIIATSGFDQKNARVPQGLLGPVQNIHKFNAPSLNGNQVDWRWKKPLSVTSKGNVKVYKVFTSATPDFNTALLIGTPRKARFLDSNTSGATIQRTYWFCAVSSEGDGALSAPVTIQLLSA